MITIDHDTQQRGGEIPAGFYVRPKVSQMTGISVSTLFRWQSEGLFMPQSSVQRGQVKVWLYSESQVEDLLRDPPYQKLGRPPKNKNGAS